MTATASGLTGHTGLAHRHRYNDEHDCRHGELVEKRLRRAGAGELRRADQHNRRCPQECGDDSEEIADERRPFCRNEPFSKRRNVPAECE
jgi:hypothetical protein